MPESFALRRAATVLAAAAAIFPVADAFAQSYPARPVRVVVAYPAGGANDFHARLIAQKLTESMGQQFVVENRAGAAGNIAFEHVAKAAPDGYTLLMGAGSMTVAPSLYSKLGFDVLKDFAPISIVATIQNVTMLHPSVPARSVKELVALAKANPGRLNYASSGIGATPHLSAELLKTMAGIDMVHVPYKGDTPAYADLLGGQVDLMISVIAGGIGHIRAGKLRAISVTGMKRAPALPDVPTMHEAGLPGYEIVSWFGLIAPAGTPRPIVDSLHAQVVRATAAADVRERFSAAGSEAGSNTPEQFVALMRDNVAKFARIVKAAGAKLE